MPSPVVSMRRSYPSIVILSGGPQAHREGSGRGPTPRTSRPAAQPATTTEEAMSSSGFSPGRSAPPAINPAQHSSEKCNR